MNVRPLVLCLLLALPIASPGASAAGAATPYFHYNKVRMDTKHAYAFVHEERSGPASTYLFLTTDPLDAQKVADAFDPGSEVNQQVGGKPGGYVRICINAEGKECGLYFSHDEPSESFNLSGSGEFTLAKRTPQQVDGRWSMTKPEDFFGKTYDFDLPFSARFTAATPGTPLPADGGAPGKAYAAYLAALAKGDLPSLRRMLGESSRWQLPEGDEQSARQGLKDLRDGKPVTVKILSAIQRGDRAVLKVEGVDRDEIKRSGRVLMVKDGDTWRAESQDLGSVD
jgi:hypothetical protein